MFRDLLKGLKKEAEKIIEEVEEWEDEQEETWDEETYESVPAGRYGRLAAWIKSNYGDRFFGISTTDEVQEQLERIVKELERGGKFRDYPDALKGFKSYINKREYGELVRISE